MQTLGMGAADWSYEDAWILVSLDPSPSLTVANADTINHAILMFEEVRESLGRLVGSGLANPRGAWFARTAAGNQLVGDKVGGSTTRAVLSQLSAVTLLSVPVEIDEAAFDAAVQDYAKPWALGSLWRRIAATRPSPRALGR